MEPRPILPSATDLERRRLESTMDQDLHSLSLASLITSSDSTIHLNSQSRSMSSISSVEYPRGLSGPHGTPRAASRNLSVGTGESPVSTAGHHVSAMTLADGVYERKGARGRERNGFGEEDDWDPERSLGRLVGELGRVMSDRISPRPTSPFSPPRSPRSPSPFASILGDNPNLSFTLNRNDPLPSPPASRSGSGSSGDYAATAKPVKAARPKQDTGSRFSSMARELGNELKARRVLGESTTHNAQQTPAPRRMKEKSRVRTLQDEGRRSSAPGRVEQSADVTGLTGLMETPAKGGEFGGLGKNGDVGGDSGGTIPQTLATLHARLRGLETENALCRRRVRELEGELDRARSEVQDARKDGDRRLREVVSEKTALEDLVKSLRSHLARLTIELEQNKALVSELRLSQQPQSPPRSGNTSVQSELADLRRAVERLGKEVQRLGGIVEEGLETRRKARGERTVRMEADEAARLVGEVERERVDEVERARRDVEKRQAASTSIPAPISAPSKLRQGLHTAAVPQPKLMPPTVQPPTRIAHRPTPPPSDDGNSSPTPASRSSSSHRSKRVHQAEGPASPFPSIRAEDEGEFFAALGEPLPLPASARPSPWSMRFTTAPPVVQPAIEKPKSRSRETSPLADPLPPQTVLARVLRELEDDFAHYKACVPSPSSSSASQADGKVCSVYAELADSYKVLDAASAVAKRKILAQHLREVIDTLEQKVSRVSIYHLAEGRLENGEVLGDDEVQADQIASLYELLNFHDKPDNRDSSGKGTVGVKKSVADVLRMVRESLGEEGARRLEEDGVVGRRLHRVV